ncbi:MAG TPA: aldo/keto reductase [Rhodospirillales bacterium]|nr:MAG: L-glyceraldehyde 3-phosphate reductase [Alphaproteobacteria bacterium MarineAlpha3_Bin2]HIM25508.1 aldo/keto reductase [Rhodospirillales bacterium]
MEYRRLGASGLRVSPICLGTMMFGGRTSEKASRAIISSARDAGVNFIDTANTYVKGESERITGRAIKRHRHEWVLATKGGNPIGKGPNDRGLGAKNLHKAIDDSLQRLGTDFVDIYYFHLDDLDTPMEESITAVTDIIRQGKARYWGISNYTGWRAATLCSMAEAMGAPLPVACQPYYNAMNRTLEIDLLPACDYFGLGVVPYSPLARGVLTGKYTVGKKADKGTRAGVKDSRMMETEFRPESIKMAKTIKKHAESHGLTAGQFAFNWVLNNQIVTSVVAGPRTMGQWKDYLGALRYEFTAEDETLIDGLVPSGHPSTPGFSDPKFPIQGRQPWTGGAPKTSRFGD